MRIKGHTLRIRYLTKIQCRDFFRIEQAVSDCQCCRSYPEVVKVVSRSIKGGPESFLRKEGMSGSTQPSVPVSTKQGSRSVPGKENIGNDGESRRPERAQLDSRERSACSGVVRKWRLSFIVWYTVALPWNPSGKRIETFSSPPKSGVA